MKTLYIINGTYGIEKKMLCEAMCLKLPLAIYLNVDEFVFNKVDNTESKMICLTNLKFIVNNYLESKTYQTIILFGLFANLDLYQALLKSLKLDNTKLVTVTLTCSKKELAKKIDKKLLAKAEAIDDSYQAYPTTKIDTSKLQLDDLIKKIVELEIN